MEASQDRFSRREDLRIVRKLSQQANAVGVAILAVSVPVVLWDHLPHGRLAAWGVALAFVNLLTTCVSAPLGCGVGKAFLRHGWNLSSTLLWAMLPWLEPSALQVSEVAWIMAFVVVYGVATDIVFVPQTLEVRLFRSICFYSASYLLAFVLSGQGFAAFAVFGMVVALLYGGSVWRQTAAHLIAQRDANHARATRDELTGLASREAAVVRLNQLIEESPPGAVVNCVFADIDDFKHFNDTYGYDVGDDALRTVAAHLRSAVPAAWTVARFGGDEFVAIGVDLLDLSLLLDVVFHLPVEFGGVDVVHRISVGCSSLPVAHASVPVLFREAAAALRQAKALGKHRAVCMTDEERLAASARNALGRRIGSALEDGEIVAWGQPIVALRSGQLAGIELLARWPQPDGSMVMPADFVPLIEDQGRGPQLGMVMIANGIDVLTALGAQDMSHVWVSVNLSALHLFDQRLPYEIRVMLEEAQIAPSRLVLEITESQYLPSSPVWKKTAEQLRTLGVGLAIDDFGTGYSSMEQLLSMPFNHLKVDRVVVQAFDRPGAFDLAAAMAAMAEGAGMTPIAEGIETEQERQAMMRAGFHHGQGYLFARPQPIDQLLAPKSHAAKADRAEVPS